MGSVAQEAPEKRVSWAELFFDLVYVVAVTRVSALIARDHDGLGLLDALVDFVRSTGCGSAPPSRPTSRTWRAPGCGSACSSWRSRPCSSVLNVVEYARVSTIRWRA